MEKGAAYVDQLHCGINTFRQNRLTFLSPLSISLKVSSFLSRNFEMPDLVFLVRLEK